MNTRRILRTALLALAALLAAATAQAQVGDDYGNTPTDALPLVLTNGATLVNGVIADTTDIDMFQLTLSAGALVSLQTTPGVASVGSTETFVLGYGGQVDTVGAISGETSVLEHVLPAGVYYIAVYNGVGGTGDYALSVEVSTKPDSRATVLNPALGTPIAGSIVRPHEIQVFKVKPAVPGVFKLAGLDSATPELLDTRGALRGSNGLSLLEAGDDSTGSLHFNIGKLLAAGSYYLFVDQPMAKTGTFQVVGSLLDVPQGILGVNQSLAGSIAESSGVALYDIVVPSDQTLVVFTTGGTDTIGTLYNAAGPIRSDDDSGPAHNFSFAKPVTAGTYRCLVETADGAPGAFTLHAMTGPLPSLANGVKSSINLAPGGTAAQFLKVKPEGAFLVSVEGTLDINIKIIDSLGAEAANVTGTGNFSFTQNLAAGTYWVLASSPSGTGGTFGLTISRVTAQQQPNVAPVTTSLLF